MWMQLPVGCKRWNWQHLAGAAAILVTELRMDPVDGASLARLVARLRPGTRILFVSGWDANHLVLNAPLLPKPFSAGQLVGAVQELLRTGVSPEATARGDELG